VRTLFIKRLPAIQLLVLAAGLAGTALVAALPSLDFAYRSREVHVAIETGASATAALAAFLLYGRLRQTGSRRDLGLIVGLALLSVSNLAAALLPSFDGANDYVVWVPLIARLVGASVLTWAAFASPTPLRRPSRAPVYLASAALCTLGVLGIGWAAVGQLPTGLEPNLSPMASDSPHIVGAPGFIATQIVVIALIGVAAVGFTRSARRSGDELLGWIATGTTLAAIARLNYLLFPSISSDWVFTGDVARLAAYLAILVGAFRQIAAYQRSAARVAVLEERNRIARELHDGLAQDLAYISMQSRRLAERDGGGAAALAGAADRALAQSRGAIDELTSTESSLSAALTPLARELTDRANLRLELDLDEQAEANPDVRENLLRIVSEAISNAIRHGEASVVRIRLDNHHGLRLSIADDGAGFDPDRAANGAPKAGGFGLRSMSDRAILLGGSLLVTSQPGTGTEVEVVLR
jgi:signal transduction histidine kinase